MHSTNWTHIPMSPRKRSSLPSTFELYISLKGQCCEGQQMKENSSIRNFISLIYEKVGWPEELVNEDVSELLKQNICSVEILERSISRGYGYQLGMMIPPVSIDWISTSLNLPIKPRFSMVKDCDERLLELIKQYQLELLGSRMMKPIHFGMISRKGWKKVNIPIGIKVLIEDILDLNPPKSIMSSPPPPAVPPGPSSSSSLAHHSQSSIRASSSPGRILIHTAMGRVFEADRFCPHKGADLAGAPVIGTILDCPKHHWKFDLSQGGRCIQGKNLHCTLNAIPLDW